MNNHIYAKTILKQYLVKQRGAVLSHSLSAATLLLGTTAAALANNPAYEKVALIIGNSDYVVFPDLPNAVSDAAAISDMLTDAGYLVFEKTDLTKKQFSASIAEISKNLNSSSEVVFFFAGHGLQIGSENYLIPTNSNISDLSDVPLESISLTHVLEQFSTQSGSQIVLLDSCRSNPFAGQQAYSGLGTEKLRIENGFSFQSAPVNSLISFSTAPGAVALDGEGDNSPYTSSLVQATVNFPEHDIASVLPIVRAQVFEETDGFQVPWESSSLLKPVFLSNRALEPALLQVAQNLQQDKSDTNSVIRDVAARAIDGITVDADVNRHVPLFNKDRIQKLGTFDEVVVTELPANGTLGVKSGDRLRLVQRGETLSATAAARLTYSPALQAVKASEVKKHLSDRIDLHVQGASVGIDIALTYNACDLAAASPLDPQALGLSVENFEMVPDTALAACTQAVADHPDESRFHYQLARAQSAKRLFDEAVASAQTALDMGHTRANLGLGQMKLDQRSGIGKDSSKAVPDDIRQHYLDGHNLGDPMATYLLGRQLIRFGDTVETRGRGFALLHRSKDAGYVEALNELARYFLLAEDGNANPQRGLQYLEESGARGNNYGFNSLGIVYKNGVGGIEPSFEKAVQNFEAAANLNHPTAPTSLGRIFAEGKLTKPDFVKALAWYEEGLSRADPWGGTNAATLILLGKIPDLGKGAAAVRSAKAAALKTESARRGAMDQLNGLSKRDLARGLQMLLLEMGQKITVDGDAGNQTTQAIIKVYGALVPLESKNDVINALLRVAETYWRESRVRTDLD